MAKRKTAKPDVELTREERIVAAWKRYDSYGRADKDLTPSVPACRVLAIGDKVEVGNLRDCVVAGLSDDARFVLVEYTSVDNNYGSPIATEGALGVWPWYEVFALDQIEDTQFTGSLASVLHPERSVVAARDGP